MKRILAMMMLNTALVGSEAAAPALQSRVYIGTYTGSGSEGIYSSSLDHQSGELSKPALAAKTENPSFVAIHPKGGFLYAVNEVSSFDGKSGGVTSFSIDQANGKLKELNQQPSMGADPCHLVVDKQGANVLVANYTGGSVAVFPIGADGKLQAKSAFVQHTGSSVNPQRQKEPHAHSINLDAANRFAVAADLGMDKLLVYRFDSGKGSLTPHNPHTISLKPGAGPRHFAFGADPFAFVVNELDSTVTALKYDQAAGSFAVIQTISTLPADFKGGNSCAEIRVHPSGKFVYASNRGHNSIAVYKFDQNTARLALVDHHSTQGKTPRNFEIDPSGKFLLAANQDSNSVVVFRIEPETGRLAPTGSKIEVSKPVCIRFLPSAK